MRYSFFTIPALSPAVATAELNALLASRRIAAIEKHFVADGQNSFWAISVSFLESAELAPSGGGKNKVDYKELLSEKDFSLYVKLRDLRKKLADQDAIPAYAIFTNEQMSEMVRLKLASMTSLATIPGIGKARVEKYGTQFLALLTASEDQLSNPL
jgi:superfamily II DNA helicase RecQ